MERLRHVPTLFVHGKVEAAEVQYALRSFEAAHLPPDHGMVWLEVDDDGSCHVAIEYGGGANRLRVDSRGPSLPSLIDECVADVLRGLGAAVPTS
jgi:hypothetical protein